MKKILSLILIMFLAIALATCRSKGGGGDGAPLSSDKAITTFSFAIPAATGTIDENANTIAVAVPTGTDVKALVATFTTTGASVKVGSTVQVSGATSNDFTNPVAYNVTAADGTTATYTATITIAPISAKAITTFSIPGIAGTINEISKTITVAVPIGTNVTALVATFTTTGANVKVGSTVQVSGVTSNDFTNPVAYNVTAADGTTATYTVTVTVAPSSAKAITTFSILGNAGTINEISKTIAVTVPIGTNVTALVATFTTTGANVNVGSTVQVSGTTSNNFTNPLAYTVTAADGTTVTYMITVNVGARSSYTTNFPLTENPISEGGNWLNGGTTGLDWANATTAPGFAYGLQDPARNYTDATAVLTGTWPADQVAEATVSRSNTDNNCYQEVELRLRTSISAHSITGYEILFSASKTASPHTPYMELVRWNGPVGNFTYLTRYSGTQYGVANGDVVKASIVGNTLKAYINGVLMGTATDSTYTTGSPGIGFNLSGSSSCVHNNYGFSSFSAY